MTPHTTTRQDSHKPDPRNGLWCDIHDFDQLFLSNNDRNAKDSPERGLPFGTSVLLSGPPGSGKTTFALALARSIMIRAAKDKAKDRLGNGQCPKYDLFYISPEVSRERLENNYREFGWFEEQSFKVEKFATQPVWNTPDTKDSPQNFHAITTYPEMDRPVPSPDDQVNHIFNRIARTITPTERQSDPDIRYIVVVDSITALLKGCLTPGDERRQTHEILHRFTTAFGKDKLALILMTAEQDHSDEPGGRHSLVEDYLAGIVIRLAHQPLPLGRTTRTLEILKSQGIHMVPGVHTWAIVTNDRYEHHLRTDELRHKVITEALSWLAGEPPSPTLPGLLEAKSSGEPKWGTVAIFARPKLQHLDLKPTGGKPEYLSTGTPGLDEILMGKHEYWLRMTGTRQIDANNAPIHNEALQRGKTTLLAGTVGTGTTKLCLQFLLEDTRAALSGSSPKTEFLSDNRQESDKKPTSLLILLNVKAEAVVDEAWAEMMKSILHGQGNALKTKLSEIGINENRLCECGMRRRFLRVLDFTQSNFEFNHLISHLRWAIGAFKPDRIAFDGLSEYLIRSNSADAPGMLEAISSLIIHHPHYTTVTTQLPASRHKSPKNPKRPAVMMTYELTMDGDPLAPQSLGVSADNIVAVRQVTLQDEIHKVVYVVKSGNGDPDQNVRELFYNQKSRMFEVRSGLDSFNGLLSGKVKKAEVLLQLFGENRGEKAFNSWLRDRVTRLSKLKFTMLDFSRPEIGRTLEDTYSQTLFPPADLKLVSVDEWWLAYDRGIAGASSANNDSGTADTPDRHVLLNLGGMWNNTEDTTTLSPSWQDHLYFELDKTFPHQWPHKTQGKGKPEVKYYGVPAHMDYGMFCVNVPLLKALGEFKNLAWPDEDVKVEAPPDEDVKVEAPPDEDVKVEAPPEQATVRNHLSKTLPPIWAKQIDIGTQDSWFDSQCEGTLANLMANWKRATENNPEFLDHWGFSFDIATRENCVSFFLELAWAFGASEDCLSAASRDTDQTRVRIAHCKTNTDALVAAMRFLQYLVLEGFMPHRASVETSRKSLFSRHYYSTLRVALEPGPDLGSLNADRTRRYRVWPSIIAMPWFPGGIEEEANVDDMTRTARGREICRRTWNLMQRSREGRNLPESTLESGMDNLPNDVKKVKTMAQVQKMTSAIEEALVLRPDTSDLQNSNGKPPKRVATQNDLIIMLRQHLYRLRHFQGEAKPGEFDFALAGDIMLLEPKPVANQQPRPPGFCCSGSWYYGVHRTSASPSLARELLQEMTSLEAAKEMARLGAGIPARGDFFEFHGQDAVPGMEYLSWNQLVTERGAIVRRRGRTIDPTVNPSPVHQCIYREILDGLQKAHLRARSYKNGGVPRAGLIRKVNAECGNAIKCIVDTVKENDSKKSARNVSHE